MIIGLGTDIIKIDRIRNMYKDVNDPFIIKTYTENERREALKTNNPSVYFASRFAAKEAVFKSLGASGNTISLNEIEILNQDTGQPVVSLYSKFKESAQKKSIKEILISLSYETDYAIAFAIAQG